MHMMHYNMVHANLVCYYYFKKTYTYSVFWKDYVTNAYDRELFKTIWRMVYIFSNKGVRHSRCIRLTAERVLSTVQYNAPDTCKFDYPLARDFVFSLCKTQEDTQHCGDKFLIKSSLKAPIPKDYIQQLGFLSLFKLSKALHMHNTTATRLKYMHCT